eukprot:5902085-Amphidinium_carterae.1
MNDFSMMVVAVFSQEVPLPVRPDLAMQSPLAGDITISLLILGCEASENAAESCKKLQRQQ